MSLAYTDCKRHAALVWRYSHHLLGLGNQGVAKWASFPVGNMRNTKTLPLIHYTRIRGEDTPCAQSLPSERGLVPVVIV